MRKVRLQVVELLGTVVLLSATMSQPARDQPHGVIATVSLSSDPALAVVDERTRHAFVVSWNFGSYADSGVPTYPGTMTMLDAQGGAILGTTPVGIYSVASAVDKYTSRVFVVNVDKSNDAANPTARGSVSVLDSRSGALIRRAIVGRLPSAVAVDERTSRVFVANEDSSTVSMLDAQSGRLIRTVSVPRRPGAIAVDEQAERVFTVSSTTVSILDARTATVRGTVKLQNGMIATAAVVNAHAGRIFVVNNDAISVLDEKKGAIVRTITLGIALEGAVIDERTNRLFILSQEKNVEIMLDATRGTVLATISLGTSGGTAVVDRQLDRVFVGATDQNNDSVVDVLDAHNGRVLDRVAVSGDAKAIDERTGRVFVLDGLSGMVSLVDANVACVVHS